MPLAPGTRLGPYEIVGALGAGGMGEVYRARDTRLEREVAVKVLPEHLSASPEARQRFEREARSASSLNHPSICTVHDIGTDDGIGYLVMELLDGETLADRLERGPLPLDELLKIALPLLDGLDLAHRSGLVHRDLKPGNVMLVKDGSVKLLDFGLAKGLEATAPTDLTSTPTMTSPLTAAGMILGTFQYMAPEQIEGREADTRSDLFAFGAMLYEMATGGRAFQGETQASLMASILKDVPRPLSEIHSVAPIAFERVVERCLAKDPEDRWQSARDLAAALRWTAEVQPETTGAEAMPQVATVATPRWLWVAAAVVAAAMFAAGWLLSRPQETPQPVIRSSLVLPPGTSLDTDNRSLALSPDGRSLAYAASLGGAPSQLWTRRLDSMSSQPLAGTGGATYPFWSPDGRTLGFFADGKLRKIPATGGTAQTICDADEGRGASWGADNVIVFAPRPFGPLMQVAAAGGTPAPASVEDRPDWSHRNPHFLPDGKRLLYAAIDAGGEIQGGIYSLDLDSGRMGLLLETESEGIYVEPGYLTFVREGNLMAQRIDAGTLEFQGEAVPIAEGVQFNSFRWTGTYSFSPAGLLVYRSGAVQSESQLTWFDLEGNQLGTVGEPAIFWFAPDISPDGQRAVVTIRHADGKSGVWMYDLQRGLGGRFTFGDTPALIPLWSPDGTKVAYVDGSGNGYVKPADGIGAPRTITPGDGGVPGVVWDWTPDGKALLMSQQTKENQNDLIVVQSEGEPDPVLFHSTPADELSGKFSPDGRWLAFISDESGRFELYVFSYPASGGRWQISSGGVVAGNSAAFAWTPDASGLVYETPDRNLVLVKLTAQSGGLAVGAARQLFGGKFADLGATGWTLAPDGKRILAMVPVANDVAPALTLVTNWAAALEQP